MQEVLKSLPADYDLKTAKADYQLWDKVHAKEVVAHLVILSKWEPPGKRELDRKRKLAAFKSLAAKANEETNEDRLKNLEERNKASQGKNRWIKAKGVVRLSGFELYNCMKQTRFDKSAVVKWHR